MQYIYAALLLHAEGKEINEANVKKVMEAAGAKVDDVKIKALVASLDGVNIEEATAKAALVAAPAAPAAATDSAVEEVKKEEPEAKDKTEEEAAAGLGALFG